jgi:8-oxo-dGTP diphosphatase
MEHSTYFPDSFHRVVVKGLCVRDGKLLLMRESKGLSGRWELPGGGLDFGEDFHTAFKREVEEEMKLKVTKMSKSPVYIFTHRYESNSRNIGWYYSLVLAYQVEFDNLDFTPTDSCESIAFHSKEDLSNIELNGQTIELLKLFDPADFREDF